MYNPKSRHRRSIRLKEYDYSNPNWYYITICTHNKNCILGEINNSKMMLNEYGKIVEEKWREISKHFVNVSLDYFVVMPNHLHGIIIIESRDKACPVPTGKREFGKPITGSLPVIIGSFKSTATKRINEIRKKKFPVIWQRNYYEYIIRNEVDLFNTRKYIEQNPLRWELDEYYNLRK
jgi:REP-associated tyrosine transposase